ncbi:MAG: IreB family regulatory phosphoprotein [Ruminococcaceae bacterium]|nr:IreB family regulatory phosphoprotein [Oscillospiraceae bacterium]
MSNENKTITFTKPSDQDIEIRRVLGSVYQALKEKGYNPINQLVGYIISEDPTYITNHNGARSLIRKVDRDELLALLLKSYLNSNF